MSSTSTNNRFTESQNTSKEQEQKLKNVISKVAEHFICPITWELPIDPVTAEDGIVYERRAIEECIRTQGSSVRSPCTNEPMGTCLFPAIKTLNAIEELVQSGAVHDELAEAWKQRLVDRDEVAATWRRADSGKTCAMYDLANWFAEGQKGLGKDMMKSCQWLRRAADCGHVRSMALLGRNLLLGAGEEKNESEGMFWLGAAAQAGSDYATFIVGNAYHRGLHGMPKDRAKAKLHWSKVVDQECKVETLNRDSIELLILYMRVLEAEDAA